MNNRAARIKKLLKSAMAKVGLAGQDVPQRPKNEAEWLERRARDLAFISGMPMERPSVEQDWHERRQAELAAMAGSGK